MRKARFLIFVGVCFFCGSLAWVQGVSAERVCSDDGRSKSIDELMNPPSSYYQIKVGDVWDSRCDGDNSVNISVGGTCLTLFDCLSGEKVWCITLKAIEDSIIGGKKKLFQERGSIALKSGAIIKVSFKGENVELSVKKGRVKVMEYQIKQSAGCQDILNLIR